MGWNADQQWRDMNKHCAQWKSDGHWGSYSKQTHPEGLQSRPDSRRNERSEAAVVQTCGQSRCGIHQPRELLAPRMTPKAMDGLPAGRHASCRHMLHQCWRPDEVAGKRQSCRPHNTMGIMQRTRRKEKKTYIFAFPEENTTRWTTLL